MRFFSFVATVCSVFLLVACGGTGPVDLATDGATVGPGGGQPGSGSGGGNGGGGSSNPQITFDDAAYDLGASGGFPSGIELDGQNRVYVVSDATIPATLRVIDASSGSIGSELSSITITASDLIDHDGANPARAPTTFGSGLFGAFTGDIEVVANRYVLLTVGAGNSASDDGVNPLYLANVVVLDRVTGTVVQAINVGWSLDHVGEFSGGGGYTAIPQSLPVSVKFVPDDGETLKGEIHVAMSNGAGSTAGLGSFYSGTVQTWRADFLSGTPLTPETSGKAATDVTRTHVSAYYNPVSLTHVLAASGNYLMVTDAGASWFNANGAVPTTQARMEFLDLDTDAWRDTWSINLGLSLPAAHEPALGRDGDGDRFAMFTSQTFGFVYAVDLSGLDEDPVDTGKLRLLQAAPITQNPTLIGAGFQSDVALRGDFAIVSSFTTTGLTVLELPEDIATGEIRVNPDEFGTASMKTTKGFGLGHLTATNIPGVAVIAILNGGFFPPSNSALVTLDADGLLD